MKWGHELSGILMPWALLLSTSCTSEPGRTKARTDSAAPQSTDVEDSGKEEDVTDTGEAVGPGFVLHPSQPCETPLSRVRYRERGAELGLEGPRITNSEHGHGGGIAVDDFDADGDFDVVITHTRNPPVLYRRTGDGFVAEELEGPKNSFLPSVADFDQDGDPDLVVSGHYKQGQILTNDGTGHFTLSDFPSEIEHPDVIREFSVGDLDGDQVMDLFATVNRGTKPVHGGDRVLQGLGDMTFEQLTRLEPSTGTGRGFDAQWLDWDGDGDLDVYVVNDEGWSEGGNVLFENDNGTLREATEKCACGLEIAGMGVDAGDFNGDGLEDLYVTATGQNHLLQGTSDGSYIDTTLALNANPILGYPDMAWGAVWLDYDNDGLRDLLVAKGDLWYRDQEPMLPQYESPIVMLAQRDSGFTDESADLTLAETGSWRSVVAFDDNGDGILDLLVSAVEDRPHFYISKGCTAAGWLAVEAPLGSKIELTARGQTQVAWATHDSSYGATSRLREHFGLGPAQEVEQLKVTLPTGETRTTQNSFAARRVVTVAP